MDITSAFFEYLNTALSFMPDLILSIILRTVIVATILLFAIKRIRSKVFTQLTAYQLVIFLSLRNSVAGPMINKEIPILSIVTVVLIIILISKGLDYVSVKSKRMDKITSLVVLKLVKDRKLIIKGC